MADATEEARASGQTMEDPFFPRDPQHRFGMSPSEVSNVCGMDELSRVLRDRCVWLHIRARVCVCGLVDESARECMRVWVYVGGFLSCTLTRFPVQFN